jgi:hypothetical protein
MISTKDRVKYKSRKVFIEAEPPADRSRPLEWRRSINTIDINASRFTIKEHHSVTEHEYDFDFGEKDDEPEKVLIKPKVGLRRVVTTKVDLHEIRDSVYRMIEEDKDEKIFSFLKSKDHLELTLTDDEPVKNDVKIFAQGTQSGHVWIDEDDEYLCINVSVGKDVLSHLIAEIKAGRVAEVQFRVALDSFTFEVDDALREWYHPRDIVIDRRTTFAALESFSIVSREYAQLPSMIQSADSNEKEEQQATFFSPQINNVIDTSYLKPIKTALWVIAGVLVFMWLGGKK